ncbi:MAG TPA: hypothetical protein VGH84_17315 [Steroidobacteraceae bacterium]|jgi:hypothetical protein
MECVPAVKESLLQAALRVLPDPVSATELQPLSVVPRSAKATLPVGAVPLTVAVNVTGTPAADGLAELRSVVVVAANTDCTV